MSEPFVKVSTHVAGIEAWYWIDSCEIEAGELTEEVEAGWTPKMGPPAGGHWSLTHAVSGRTMGEFVGLHAVLYAAHKLSDLVDWTDEDIHLLAKAGGDVINQARTAIEAALAVDTEEAPQWIGYQKAGT